MSNNQQIFENWLAGKISTGECAELLQHDATWLARMHNASALRADAARPEFNAVPQVDTSSIFANQWQRSKPQRSWWPQISLALSCAAMLISLSPAQLQLKDGSLTLSWHNSQQEIDSAVNKALVSYQQEQQQWLAQQLDFQQGFEQEGDF